MIENLNNDIPQLSEEENKILTADFLVKEVYDAIFQMEMNKAPRGLMDFQLNFIKPFGRLLETI